MKSVRGLSLVLLTALLQGCVAMSDYSSYPASQDQEEECCENPFEGRRSSDTSARGID